MCLCVFYIFCFSLDPDAGATLDCNATYQTTSESGRGRKQTIAHHVKYQFANTRKSSKIPLFGSDLFN